MNLYKCQYQGDKWVVLENGVGTEFKHTLTVHLLGHLYQLEVSES